MIISHSFLQTYSVNFVLQEYEQEKLKTFHKFEMDLTEVLNLNESNKTKNLLRKLSNHCNQLEREQKNLIVYLNFVTVDFLKVREKVLKTKKKDKTML